MIVDMISACVTTDKVEESRDFYIRYFDAKVTFDCGWYVSLQIGKETSQLRFIAPQDSAQPTCNPAGLMYNLAVADVDTEYARLLAKGVKPMVQIEDHPWGDRGFTMLDPNGITLYIYSIRPPAGEFRRYFQ